MMKAVMEAVFGAAKTSSKWVPEAGAAFKARGVYGGLANTSKASGAAEAFLDLKGRNTPMSSISAAMQKLERTPGGPEGGGGQAWSSGYRGNSWSNRNQEWSKNELAAAPGFGGRFFQKESGFLAQGGRLLDRLPGSKDLSRITVDQAAERFVGFNGALSAKHMGIGMAVPQHLGKAPAWTGKPLKSPSPSRYAGNTSNLMKNTHNASSRRELFTTGGMLGSVFGGIESFASGFSAKRGNKIGR